MKKVLVAGGGGFIGTRLCNQLCVDYDVTAIDLLWFGDHLSPKVKKIQKNISQLKSEDLVTFDVVIFVAGLSNDPMANFRPDLNFIENGSISTYLAYIAKQAGVKRFIAASSCSVYGFTNNQQLTEDDPVKPAYAYGISKLQSELGILTLEDQHFRPILFRKGTVGGYSPRMRFDLAVNTMLMSALTKGRITINNPLLWRPLIDIRDVVEAYRLAIEADDSISGVFNLAQDNYTIGQLGEILQKTLHSRGYNVDLEVLNVQDMRNYLVSTKKLKDAFGFVPSLAPQDTVEDILSSIDVASCDFTKSEYYNIEVFKQVVK